MFMDLPVKNGSFLVFHVPSCNSLYHQMVKKTPKMPASRRDICLPSGSSHFVDVRHQRPQEFHRCAAGCLM